MKKEANEKEVTKWGYRIERNIKLMKKEKGKRKNITRQTKGELRETKRKL